MRVAAGGLALAVTLGGGACDPGALAIVSSPRDGPVCGDGRLEGDEECDLGFANRADGSCRACRRPVCGDGVVDPGEACDDGDDDERDGCRVDCTASVQPLWSRVLDAGIDDERVVDLVVDGGGDVFVVGQRDAGAGTKTRIWVARFAPGGDPRWSRDLPTDGRPAAGAAIARRPGGDILVAGTLAQLEEDPGEPWVALLDAGDGAVRIEAVLAGAPGLATGAAASDEALAVAVSTDDGAASVLLLDAALEIVVDHRPGGAAPVGVRALALLSDGDLVAGGSLDDALGGWIERLSPSGVSRWMKDDLGAPVVALAIDAEGVVVAQQIADPAGAAASVTMVALRGDGTARWSSTVPAGSGHMASSLAIAPIGIVLGGSELLEDVICSPLQCEGQPWLWVVDPGDGATLHTLLLGDRVFGGEARGRALAVGVDADGLLIVGGEQHRVFARPDAWLSRWQGAIP